ncbi:hypothetical protein [Pelotomaculum propionicicum]|nr:hypothetical protein [Pelotomaculum propionicicum]
MSAERLKNFAAKYPVFLILILLMLLLGLVSQAGGEGNTAPSSLEERGKDLARQAELSEREKELVNELLNWDLKIESARQEQEKLQREIPALEAALTAAETELSGSRVHLAEGYDWLGHWVNSLYRHGPVAYLEVLVGVSDFNQFVERAEMVRMIIAAQVKTLEEVRMLADRVQAQVNSIKQTRDQLAAKNEALSIQIGEMAAAKTGREQFLTELRRHSRCAAPRGGLQFPVRQPLQAGWILNWAVISCWRGRARCAFSRSA